MYERKKLSTSEQEAIYSEWVAWRGIVTADDFEAAMGKGALKVGMNFADYRHLIVSTSLDLLLAVPKHY